ncbi:MAG TPA: MBOAT family O-acyltransferase [Candidatus Bathyarchaeia archaeon]|nr:MBOAT family O-acyltransferase [Candidatus Bathyarchaeia archaeon]
MLFNSTQFIVFFPLVGLLYFVLPHRLRWLLLLGASYFFYMSWEPGYVVLLAVSTAAAYAGGLLIGRTRGRGRTWWLAAGLGVNFGLLFLFKYYNFFAGELRPLLTLVGVDFSLPVSRFLLPLGISFYTFQACSYLIDVYRGKQAPERHLGLFALYVSFFPQLVAGPIERAGHLLPQLRARHRFDYDAATNGLKLMAWGFFKKIVIADRLAVVVEQVYGQPGSYGGPALAIATVCFAFQIFCDFSGYTDIAIGCARVLGFRLTNNFRRPYFAVSVADFWRRWHISLTSWFRDYVYIPLGGNRVGEGRWRINIAAVFLLSGLWHGASWMFLAWGAIHAGYIIFGKVTMPMRERLSAALGLTRAPRVHRAVRAASTFALVCFAWIFFRAQSMADAVGIVRGLVSGWGAVLDPSQLYGVVRSMGVLPRDLAIFGALIAILEVVHVCQARGATLDWLSRRPLPVRWALYSALIWTIVIFGVFRQKEFIYFTF